MTVQSRLSGAPLTATLDTGEREQLAVLAHRLLNMLAAASGSASVLRESWRRLDEVDRDALLGEIERSAGTSARIFSDLARGLPLDLVLADFVR